MYIRKIFTKKSVTPYCFYLNNAKSRNLSYPSKNYTFSTKRFRYTTVRAYSTSKNNDSSTDSSNVIVFSDADKDKLDILKYVKGTAGIYMWTNKLNGKKYVGSSMALKRRLLEYYNVNRLLNEKSMPINVALLKYGYSNFSHYFRYLWKR